jgi:hypothetical protein
VCACYETEEGLDTFAIIQEVCEVVGAGGYFSAKRMALPGVGWACGTESFCDAM